MIELDHEAFAVDCRRIDDGLIRRLHETRRSDGDCHRVSPPVVGKAPRARAIPRGGLGPVGAPQREAVAAPKLPVARRASSERVDPDAAARQQWLSRGQKRRTAERDGRRRGTPAAGAAHGCFGFDRFGAVGARLVAGATGAPSLGGQGAPRSRLRKPPRAWPPVRPRGRRRPWGSPRRLKDKAIPNCGVLRRRLLAKRPVRCICMASLRL